MSVKKRLAIACLLLSGILLCNIYSFKIVYDNKDTCIITLSIRDIISKTYDNEYYLGVVLDDSVAEEYSLKSNDFVFKTTKSVYDKIIVNSGFVGISVEITNFNNFDGDFRSNVETILRNCIDCCKIISVTTYNNDIIE